MIFYLSSIRWITNHGLTDFEKPDMPPIRHMAISSLVLLKNTNYRITILSWLLGKIILTAVLELASL